MTPPLKIIFVCLGNICRSPMAEGVFLHLVRQAGLEDKFTVDSAGTSGYHEGELADQRMRHTAERHGIQLLSRSRKLLVEDLDRFDYIVAMDRENRRNIESLIRPQAPHGKIVMMRDFDPKPDSPDVPDPYFGGNQGFEKVYQILLRSCDRLLKQLVQENGL